MGNLKSINLKGQHRDAIQQLASSVLTNSNVSGVFLEWATGLGKTRGALLSAYTLEPVNPILLVYQDSHKKTWVDEMNETGLVLNNLTIKCIASIGKIKLKNYDVIIVDEAHHILGEKTWQHFCDFIRVNQDSKYIFASATFPDKVALKELASKLPFDLLILQYALHDAIGAGILAEPKIQVFSSSLADFSHQVDYYINPHIRGAAKLVPDRKAMLDNSNRNVYLKCTPLEWIQYFNIDINAINDRYGYNSNPSKLKYLTRKRFFNELKEHLYQETCSKYEDIRRIVFCDTVAQASRLGPRQVVSNSTGTRVLQSFQNGDTDAIYVVNMGVESLNLKGIQLAVIISFNYGGDKDKIQKIGRALRSAAPWVVFYSISGTKDADTLEEFLENYTEVEYIAT